jgi:ABC-type lipoprotein release transport system permease subunit
MMTLLDSVQLAAAKLKTHRVRTGAVVVIAALLFAGIVLVLTMLTGAARSAQSFGTEGLGSRYIVQARPIYNQTDFFMGTPAIIEQLKTRTAQLKTEKKAAAKRLNLTYDAATDMNLPLNQGKDGSGADAFYLNPPNAEVREAINQYGQSIPHLSFTDFSKLAQSAGAQTLYRSTNNSMNGGFNSGTFGSQNTAVVPVVDGKELVTQNNSGGMGEPRGVGTITSLGLTYFDRGIMTPFVLPGQSLALGADGALPVIAPMSAAEQILGLPNLPATASAQTRLDRLVKLRTDIAGKTAELCYRNSTSSDLLQQAKQQEKDIAANKNKPGYTPPSLQYAVSTEACGPVVVKKDTRSYDEKKQAENELSFKKQYENYQEPDQQIMKIRIVGFSQDMSFQPGFSARSIIENVLHTGLGAGWFAPSEAVTEGSVADKLQPSLAKRTNVEQVYYAEFATLDAAKTFAKTAGCDSKVSSNMTAPPEPGQEDPRVTDCYKKGKYFDISPFGNNASAIEDMRHGVWKVMRYVAPVVLVLASLVLMGIVGKIIADSRRETAVFRALGATRFAVAQLYLTYSLFIAGFVVVLAFVIGSGFALLFSHKLAPEASVSAVLAYGAQDIHKQFTFFGFELAYVGLVVGLIVLAALLSTVIPLVANIRRNPIRDMRDEN